MRFYDGKVIAYLDITSSPKAYEVKINSVFKLTVTGGIWCIAVMVSE